MKKLILNPVGLFCACVIACSFFWFSIPILSDGFHPNAQTQFQLRIYLLIFLVCGLFLISLLNIFLFKDWIRKYWYFNGFLTLVSGGIIIYFIIKIFTIWQPLSDRSLQPSLVYFDAFLGLVCKTPSYPIKSLIR